MFPAITVDNLKGSNVPAVQSLIGEEALQTKYALLPNTNILVTYSFSIKRLEDRRTFYYKLNTNIKRANK